jgi:diguanylate cyclase (GGDEF)-like protein
LLEEARDPDDALAALVAGGRDVGLVTDRPGVGDGIRLVRAARDRGCAAPLLVLAREPSHERDLAAQVAGADDYLPLSPIDGALLERALRYAVARRRAGADLRIQVRELEQRVFQNTTLAEMASLLQTCQGTEQACAIVAACAARLFPCESGALFLVDGKPERLTLGPVWGAPRLRPGPFAPDECAGLQRRVTPCDHLGCPPPAASWCVPLVSQGEVVGVLHVESAVAAPGQAPGTTCPLPPEQQRLAHTVADQAALALANLRLRQSLREQATRDPLTNLFNRRHMEESLRRELRRAERRKRPLGLILLDLDHFKRTNDTFGHDAGDVVLRAVGHFLQTHIRAEDLACRMGGEEFLLILADSSLEDTHRRAEQLRRGIKEVRAEYAGRPLGPVTASLGVAVFPEQGQTAECLIRAADLALFRAKAEGRDRVAVGEAPALAGPHSGLFAAGS